MCRSPSRPLRADLSRPVEFINGGVLGWDLVQYSKWLDEALERKPRIVTVGLLPNDLFSDISVGGMEARRRMLRELPAERVFEDMVSGARPEPERAVRGFLARSRALHFLGHVLMSSDTLYAASYRRAARRTPTSARRIHRTGRERSRTPAGFSRTCRPGPGARAPRSWSS